MSRRRLGNLPVFWQTVLLLLAGLVIAQLIGILLLFIEPPPRPDFNRMSDIVEALGGPREPRDRDDDRERRLVVTNGSGAPAPRARMISDPSFVANLAQRLGTAPDRVRLYFEPDRASDPPFSGHGRTPVRIRNGEPLFFTAIVAGVHLPRGWRVAATPPRPLIAPWQRRMMLWFLVSAIVLLPLALLFARAITSPIRRFAEAADRLGGDPKAPAVAEEGPAELRVTARALNRMHTRLGDYVGERTAMIGAIAHDLRTPLARIAFRIEGAPETMREKVLGDVEQMRAMLAATIGFVRSTEDAGVRVPVDILDLADAVAARECELGRAVQVRSGTGAFVLGDPLALERLLQNLVDNALAYAGAAEIAVDRDGARSRLVVRDRGPGLPDDMLERAFRPFVRGEPSRNRATGGVGLGLTIARTIAEDHGGTLQLVNREGGGVEAVLQLPAEPD